MGLQWPTPTNHPPHIVNKPYKIHSIPTPSPESLGPNDLLVKVAVASLCHTDGMVLSGVFPASLPQTASHEGAGTVVGVGSAVGSAFRPGDRVMCGLPTNRCGECVSCKGPEDRRQYCPNVKGHLGVTLDGAFAEYVVCDGRETSIVPEKVSFETAAPLACAGSTVYRGIVEAGLQAGQWVGIVGSGGGLGHLGVQFAKAKGLRVVGVDARDEGLTLTREVGADLAVDARKGKKQVVEEVQKVTGGEGCHAVVNVSDAPGAAALACAICRMHAKMIQIAQPDEVSVPFHELVFRGVKIEGSLICSKQQASDMLKTVAEHNISVKTNPFHGLEEIPDLVELAHSGHMQGKGIVIIDEEAIRREKEQGIKLV